MILRLVVDNEEIPKFRSSLHEVCDWLYRHTFQRLEDAFEAWDRRRTQRMVERAMEGWQ